MRKRSASAINVDSPGDLPPGITTIGDDKPFAFVAAEENVEEEGGQKRFKGTRKSGKVWKTRQKEP
jgi:hypothetical protein